MRKTPVVSCERRQICLPILLLAFTALACGAGQVFANRQVYSAIPGPANQFYDPITDKILADDVWVFRSDGTYTAIINVDEQRRIRSGKYEIGEDLIYLDIDYDSEVFSYADILFVCNDGSSIEWQRSDETLIYSLAP